MHIIVVGNLTDDPTLRFTPSGAAVANFTVVETPRVRNKQTNEWEDGDPSFMNCQVWRSAAENVAESLQKGMRVIVTGNLKQRSYTTKDGEKRTVWDCEVDAVGPDLKWATARVTRNKAGAGGQAHASVPADDPWAAPAAGNVPPQQPTDPWATPGR
jgi:single-strand DNA-binding protein